MRGVFEELKNYKQLGRYLPKRKKQWRIVNNKMQWKIWLEASQSSKKEDDDDDDNDDDGKEDVTWKTK